MAKLAEQALVDAATTMFVRESNRPDGVDHDITIYLSSTLLSAEVGYGGRFLK